MPNATCSSRGFALLAPALACVPRTFTRVVLNEQEYGDRLARLQRLRGSLYLEDGAIEPWQLTEDGRHYSGSDEKSWHLLSMQDGEAMGCARLQVYRPTTSFSELTVAQSALAECPEWGSALRLSVSAEMNRAQKERLWFIEAGGWALTPELRCTTEALHIALGSYAIGELLGGSLGLSTATVRHHSASILRRLGGCSFMWDDQPLPRYYDPAYGCEMEVIRFDSRQPNDRYRSLVEKIKAELPHTEVLCGNAEPSTMWQSSMSAASI
jgi:hypothetical protein